MKKKLILVSAVLLVAIIAVFAVGCSVKITTQEIWDLATFKVSSGETGRNLSILVTEDGVKLYEYKNENGQVSEYKVEGLNVNEMDLSKDGATLSLSSDYLANEKTEFLDDIAVYTADIQNTKVVLDVENAKNAKITIKANRETKQLVSTEIVYETSGGRSVTITVTPYYA